MIGIKNRGVQCHVNAALQAVRLIPEVQENAKPAVQELVRRMNQEAENNSRIFSMCEVEKQELGRDMFRDMADATESLNTLLRQDHVFRLSIASLPEANRQKFFTMPYKDALGEPLVQTIELWHRFDPGKLIRHYQRNLDKFSEDFVNRFVVRMAPSIQLIKDSFTRHFRTTNTSREEARTEIPNFDFLQFYSPQNFIEDMKALVQHHAFFEDCYEKQRAMMTEFASLRHHPQDQKRILDGEEFLGQLKGIILGGGAHFVFLHIQHLHSDNTVECVLYDDARVKVLERAPLEHVLEHIKTYHFHPHLLIYVKRNPIVQV